MNKFLLLLFLISIGLFACAESDGESNDAKGEVTERERPNENRQHNRLLREDWTVNEVIDLWINNLNERLSLSEQSQKDIRTVYQNAFREKGIGLDDQLTREEVHKIGRGMLLSTKGEVEEILTPDQFKFYKGHLIER